MTTKTRPAMNYAYMIFVTPMGKGYGCFAIDEVEENVFKVGASFCHPNDRNVFQKEVGRQKAKSKLETSKLYTFNGLVADGKTADVENKDVVMGWFFDLDNKPPSWARKALLKNAYVFKLTQDNLSLLSLIEELKINNVFIEHYVNTNSL